MKKRMVVGKIIGFIGICIFSCGIAYVVTHYLEKNKYADINLIATFEDTKEFTLENVKKLDKEGALKTYPYIFTLENKGISNVNFDLKLEDSDFSRENLDYIIVLNDKEVASGSLLDIKDDILLKGNIGRKKTDTYKVYIYYTEDVKDPKYTYSLKIAQGD